MTTTIWSASASLSLGTIVAPTSANKPIKSMSLMI